MLKIVEPVVILPNSKIKMLSLLAQLRIGQKESRPQERESKQRLLTEEQVT